MSVLATTWKATPGNISTEGIFLRLEPNAPVDLNVNTPVEVEIDYCGETLLLRGVIRSRRSGGYGIVFPRKPDEDYVNPLDRLGHIWAELQRETLAKRLFRRFE